VFFHRLCAHDRLSLYAKSLAPDVSCDAEGGRVAGFWEWLLIERVFGRFQALVAPSTSPYGSIRSRLPSCRGDTARTVRMIPEAGIDEPI